MQPGEECVPLIVRLNDSADARLFIELASCGADLHEARARLRTGVIKGPDSRAAGVAMVSKLIEPAQTRRRAVNAPHLVALVRAGATYEKGKLLERLEDQPAPTPAETAE
jgi:hypothetical protein